MNILIAVLLGSIVFLSAVLIGMALMLRTQWDPESTRHSNTRQGEPKRRQ